MRPEERTMMRPYSIAILCALALTTPACKDDASGGKSAKAESKEKEAEKEEPLEMTKLDLSSKKLPLTMQAPKGSKVNEEFGVVSIEKGSGFAVSVTEYAMGLKGEEMLSPFEKEHLKKMVVTEDDLIIWQAPSGFQFRKSVVAGEKHYLCDSSPMRDFTREQVDVMVKAAKSIKAK
jgi:hypothetical protein